MDKQDELAAVIFAHAQSSGFVGIGPKISCSIAAAVRSFLASDEVVEVAASAMATEVHLSFKAFDERTRSKFLRQARSALSAAIGEDIGGGRG